MSISLAKRRRCIGLMRLRCSALMPYVLLILLETLVLSLAVWQWVRGNEKATVLSEWETQDAVPFAADDIQSGLRLLENSAESLAPSESKSIRQQIAARTLLIDGQLQPAQVWLLDNQQVNGRTGYDVLTLFFADTAVNRQPLLLNLGWIESSYSRRQAVPNINWSEMSLAKGRVKLVFQEYSRNPFIRESADTLGPFIRVQTPVTAVQQLAMQYSSVYYAVLLPNEEQASNKTPVGFVHHYTPVVMEPQKHYAYALQWLLIGVALFFVFHFAKKKQRRKRDRAT